MLEQRRPAGRSRRRRRARRSSRRRSRRRGRCRRRSRRCRRTRRRPVPPRARAPPRSPPPGSARPRRTRPRRPRVTVLSPPQPSITDPGPNGAASAALWRARLASSLPTWRASPSRLVDTTTGARPSSIEAVRHRVAGRRARDQEHRLDPVGIEVGRLGVRPLKELADRGRRAVPEAVAVENRDRVAARVESGTVGSVIASMWSPATSETVRLIRVAGSAAFASRPPLNAETCLRTVLTSTMPMPEESSSSCSARFSARRRRRPAEGWRAPSCRR